MTTGREALREYFKQVAPARHFQNLRVRRDGRVHESVGYVTYTSRSTGSEYRWTDTHKLVDESGAEVMRLHIASNGAGFVCRTHGPTASVFQVATLRAGYRVCRID